VGVFVNDYTLAFKASARKELEALPNIALTRILTKLETLTQNPRPVGCKKLKGFKNYWRVRVGDWRVVYVIEDPAKAVTVTRIAHRRDVYE
jgi:mRNA interferase RelE/StbE